MKLMVQIEVFPRNETDPGNLREEFFNDLTQADLMLSFFTREDQPKMPFLPW